jgi:hypothetical protein
VPRRQQAKIDQAAIDSKANADRLEQDIDALIGYLEGVKPYLVKLASRKDRFKRLDHLVFQLTSCIFDDVIDKFAKEPHDAECP